MTAAQTAFVAQKSEVGALIARLTALSANHFNKSPDDVTWTDASTLEYVSAKLREVAEFIRA